MVQINLFHLKKEQRIARQQRGNITGAVICFCFFSFFGLDGVRISSAVTGRLLPPVAMATTAAGWTMYFDRK